MDKRDKNLVKIDIGCGQNKRKGFIGIDIDKNSQADIIASALDLPFKGNSIDQIRSSNLMEHFCLEDAQNFFAEIYRVLKKNAQAFLKVDVDWTKRRLLQKEKTHKHRYSVREIKKMLRQFNFSKSKVVRKIYLIEGHLRTKIFIRLVK